jgi:chromate transporter
VHGASTRQILGTGLVAVLLTPEHFSVPVYVQGEVNSTTYLGAFLDGVNVAALALMAVVGVQLGRAAIVDAPTALLAVVGAAALFLWRVNSAWLVLGGGLLGAAVRGIG